MGGGKVLVSTWEHTQRLVACRLQADILNTPLVIVARTDAEAATMIDSNIDPIDHPHIKGATIQGVENLYDAIKNKTDKDWETRAGCMTFPDAIAFAPYADLIWMETGKPILSQATQFATEVRAAVPHQMLAYNLSPSFNWDAAGM